MVRIWCIDNSTVEEDERGEHHSSQPNFLSLELVKETTGLMYWKLNTDTYEADGILDKIREDRGYTFDFVTEGSEEELPIREQWLRTFFSEHKRTNEEMRYVIGGTGYYDIRVNPDDNWIRIELSAGDLIVLPAGLYRRFTFDSKNYVKIRRFYIGEPKWPLSHIPYHEVDIVNAGGDGLKNSGEKKTGVQDIQRRSSTTSASAAKAIQSLKGRETSLGELEDSSAKLEIGADNFASASHQLMLKYKDKKWYQF